MRQDPVPSGAAAQHAGTDVGLQCGSRAHRKRGATRRVMLLRQSGRGQERCYAKR